MKHLLTLFLSTLLLSSCNQTETKSTHDLGELVPTHTRHQEDTLGFAQYAWQLDSVIARMDASDKEPVLATYKAAVSPHDDYGYAGGLYYKTLQGIKAKTIVLIGVAHRARNFELKDKIILGSYTHWDSANGQIPVSTLRDSLVANLKEETFVVHDSMMQLEHSLEAITPFLQKMNPKVEIIPILVPYMKYGHMEIFSNDIAQTLSELMKEQGLSYGEDVAVVISNDAIHYGNTDWGGSDLAPFGVDNVGNTKARLKDLKIISACLEGPITSEKVMAFTEYTVMPNSYMEYQWTWCGRYSLPFGLLVANKLNEQLHGTPLSGTKIDYRSSLHNKHIPVADIGMGHTAPASPTHWVGYVGMGYE